MGASQWAVAVLVVGVRSVLLLILLVKQPCIVQSDVPTQRLASAKVAQQVAVITLLNIGQELQVKAKMQ